MPMRIRDPKPTAQEAETLAAQALVWLATDFERLGRFLGETGLSPETVRQAARDPAFLPSVLEYLVKNETTLTEFASEQGLDPAAVVSAHTILSRPGPGS
jgi:hypothetical protein